MTKMQCIFCSRQDLDQTKIFAENDYWYAKWDQNAISTGHSLLIPKDHVDSFFDLPQVHAKSMLELAKEARAVITNTHQPDAFNIGINDGSVAGRTIHHLHLHLIPRYKADVADPKGGIKHMLPGMKNYS